MFLCQADLSPGNEFLREARQKPSIRHYYISRYNSRRVVVHEIDTKCRKAFFKMASKWAVDILLWIIVAVVFLAIISGCSFSPLNSRNTVDIRHSSDIIPDTRFDTVQEWISQPRPEFP